MNPTATDNFSLLFVDDEEHILSSLKRTFFDEGYILHAVNSGKKALYLMAEIKVHAVLIDLKMPDMDGLSLLKKIINQAALSDVTVLITGETGTGKELVAKAVHHHSPRSQNSFIVVDCTTINETMLESELFGHVKGAFTGAHQNSRGLVLAADKGTILDISSDALAYMEKYRWPGNVRELENTIRRAMALSKEEKIFLSDLPEQLSGPKTTKQLPSEDSMAAYEMAAIKNALQKCRGNRKKAAQILQIGEATLYRKLKQEPIQRQTRFLSK